LDAGGFGESGLDFASDFVGALKRSSVGQLQVDVEVTLVFIGEKAGRNFGAEEGSGSPKEHKEYESDGALADQEAANTNVGVGGTVEAAVNEVKKVLEQASASVVLGAQQQCRESRAEGKCVESGKSDGDVDCD